MNSARELTQNLRIGFLTRVAYGSGDVACNIVYGMISSLLVLFYTDYAGVAAYLAGLVMLISRIFDGVSDIVMGYIVSKTHSRFGQSRPWMLRMAIPYAVGAVLLFTIPQTSSTVLQFTYMFITYNFVTTVCYTAINLPYGSLSVMMTRDQHEREMLSIFRMSMSPVGRIIAVACTPPLVKLLGDNQAAWVKAMIVWGVLAILLLLFCFSRCEETVNFEARAQQDGVPLVRHLILLAKNPYFWAVLILWALQGTLQTVTGTVMPFYCKYIYHNDSWMYSTLYTVETVTIILTVMVCPFLRRWLSKSRAILAGSLLVIASHLIFLVYPESFSWCMFTTILRGIGQAPLSAFIFSMIGDVVEYGQWKTHIRQESYIFSGGSVGAKLGMGAAQAAITGIMTAAGYISSAGAAIVQPQSAIASIRYIYVFAPILLMAVAAVICALYRLDAMYPSIVKELSEREARGEMQRWFGCFVRMPALHPLSALQRLLSRL